jgi:carbamoyltransferase
VALYSIKSYVRLNFKKKYNATIPAVVHEDNTGRLQTVKKKDNLFYYKLIKAFFKSTRIPMLLNTSFNINEPIVCNPTDAINCFKKSKIEKITPIDLSFLMEPTLIYSALYFSIAFLTITLVHTYILPLSSKAGIVI